MAETPYTETEALIKAMEDYDADSGNTDLLDEYLRENMTQGELLRLSGAADLLSTRAYRTARSAGSGEGTG